MKSLARWILPLVVLALGLFGAQWMIASRPEVEPERIDLPPPLVRTLTLRAEDVALAVHAFGSVRPHSEVRLVAEVEGRVVRAAPELAAGSFVTAGEVLVEIDRRDFDLAVTRATAEVARAAGALAREEAEAEVAREQWQDLDGGEATPLVLREPQLAEARANLQAAEAGLARAELDLERTRLRAPFDARVRREAVDVGQFVVRAAELAVLYPTDRVEVLLRVPDEDLFALDLTFDDGQGPEVVLRANWAGAPRTWRGRVVRSEGELDPRSRMAALVAEVADPFARDPVGNGSGENGSGAVAPLELGTFVEATIAGRTLPNALRIPRLALRGPDTVYVVDAESRLELRSVLVARTERESVVVTEGLADGERVCLSPLEAPVDGMRVRVAEDGP